MTLLSAQVPYADIAFLVLLGIALIFGIIRGFAKSFKGFFLTIAIVLISLILISPTFDKVRDIEMFTKMNDAITAKISSSEVTSTPIYIEEVANEEGKITKTFWVDLTTEDGQTARTPLNTALGGGIKGKFGDWLASRFITEDGQTIGAVAGNFISDVTIMAIMFVVYCILLGIVCRLLRLIFKKLHTADSVALRVIDRVLGALISVALTLIFIFVVLAILYQLQAKIPAAHEYLSQSKVCGYFYNNNPIALLWAKIFG